MRKTTEGEDAVNIVSIEILSRGRYTPSRDPQGSLVLVAFLRRGSESEPYVEVLASFGAGYEWAVDGDRQTTWRAFAEALDDEPDGLYVLGCGWEGSGEDSDFVVFDSAAPTDEERAFISANSDFSGIEHHWAARWAGVPCRECKKPVEDHAGFEFACPSATPAAVWKEEEASMNRSRVDTEIDRLRGEPAKNRDKPESVAADIGPAWEAGGFVCLMRREVVPGRVHLPDRDDEPRETGTEVQRTEHAPACHDCGEPLSMDVADTYMLGGVLLVQRQMCCYSCGWDYGTALFGNPPDSALVEVTP